MKRYVSFLLAVIMILSTITGCGSKPANVGKTDKEDVLRVAIASDMTTFDPIAFTDLNTQLGVTALYSKLVKFDKDLNIVNDVAESYESISDLKWKFILKKGVKFHDGSELKAEDVKASLERAMKGTLIAHIVSQIDTIEIPDDYTVIITTKVPYAPFLNNLADPCCSILPKKLIDNGHDFNKSPVGSGPYTLTEWKPAEKTVFARFDDYFNKEEASAFASLELRIIPEGTSRSIALETGEVHIIQPVDAVDYDNLEKNDKVEIYDIPANQIIYLVSNEDVEPFNNKLVRQALEYAIDKEAIVNAAQDGRANILNSVTPDKVLGYIPSSYEYNPNKAKELLEQSGWVQGDKPITLNTMSELHTKMAQVIQANLKDIGINVEIEQNVIGYHMEACGRGEYTLAMSAWSTAPDPDRFLRPMFHKDSIGANNFARYNNSEISKKIDVAVAILESEKRAQAYNEIHKALMDDAAIVPISSRMITIAYDARLKNVYQDPIYGMEFNIVRFK